MEFVKLSISSLTKGQLMQLENLERNCGLEPFSRRMLLESVAEMDTFAMMDGEKIAGFITLHPSNRYDGECLYVVNLNVSEEYRRKGVATQLILSACSAYADVFAKGNVMLDVRKDNNAALALYQKLGFTFTDIPSENGETDVVMSVQMKDLLGIVQTPRLMLRRMTSLDMKEGIRILRDERVNKTYMIPDLTEESAKKLYARFADLSAKRDRYVRGIYLNNRLVGFINDPEIQESSLELGWVVDPEYHNHGFCTESVTHAIQDLFDRGFTEVLAGAFVENPASIRVMEKSAMQLIEKTEEIEYRGQTHHCIFYAIRRK